MSPALIIGVIVLILGLLIAFKVIAVTVVAAGVILAVVGLLMLLAPGVGPWPWPPRN